MATGATAVGNVSAGTPWVSTGDVVVATQDLTKQFKGFTAVNKVNLSVERGSIHALIGPNGAGKTTVFNLLTKFLIPTAGRILLDGKDITRVSPHRIARMGVVRSFQISSVFPQMTVLDNVRVALQRRHEMDTQFWRPLTSLQVLNGRAEALLEEVGLTEWAGTMAGELPYGRKRALEIATTLALEPDVLLLDEPTQGMGHEDVGRVVELIRKIRTGRTILMVEHNMGVVSTLCDRISVLQRGEILAEGDYETVSRNPQVIEAYMGSEHV